MLISVWRKRAWQIFLLQLADPFLKLAKYDLFLYHGTLGLKYFPYKVQASLEGVQCRSFIRVQGN